MEEHVFLILTVAGYIFSGDPDFAAIWKVILEHKGLKVHFESVVANDLLSKAIDSMPSLILLSHRPVGGPWGGDLVKMLKADMTTRHIPVLMIESRPDIDQIAEECGADAFLRLPAGSSEIYKVIMQLIQPVD